MRKNRRDPFIAKRPQPPNILNRKVRDFIPASNWTPAKILAAVAMIGGAIYLTHANA